MDIDPEIFNPNLDESGIITPKSMIQYLTRKKLNHEFNLPDRCLFGFFPNLNSIVQQQYHPKNMIIHKEHPYAVFKHNSIPMSYIRSGMGAPWASVLLEETIALGAKKIIIFGPCGIVRKEIAKGELILIDSAFRDEGTSYHYQKPGPYAFPSCDLTDYIDSRLQSLGLPYHRGKTWTTDALYRETPSKLKIMQEQGCLCVDMEASALFSVANYHNVDIAGFFVACDSIAESIWNQEPPAYKSSLKPRELFVILTNILSEI